LVCIFFSHGFHLQNIRSINISFNVFFTSDKLSVL
jgi:hypothetical protein